MARSAATTLENNFSKGLITEATGLNFPENACTETYNCVFEESGKVSRRLGFAYEDDYELNALSTSNTDKVIDFYVWENVAGRGDLTFVVIQFGGTLYVFQTGESESLSENQLFTISLSTFQVSGAPNIASEECTFAAGNGALFVTHPYLTPFYCEYDPDTQLHTETTIAVQIRDFTGVEDNLAIDNRPSTLSTLHKYNLYNQGWYISASCDTDPVGTGANAGTQNVLTYWDTIRSDFPSNADIWWVLKNLGDSFSPYRLERSFRGNTRAPQGHYILNAFYQDRTDVSGITGLSVVTSGYYRPSVCAFHASRLFLAGVQSADFSNKIYFSQIIKGADQYGKCYQVCDPTAEDISDLLPTDGGVIAVLEAGQIINLVSVENSLIVFATNGIWAIAGSEGKAFAANDYGIQKISDLPTQSAQSFVMVNGAPVWWTSDGIFTLVFDKISGSLQVKSLTDRTIKTFYDDIPVSSKIHAKGAYNSRTKVIQWVYRSTEAGTIATNHQYDRVLAFNTLSEAFYPWRISSVSDTLGPWVSGIVSTKGLGVIRQNENVLDVNNVIVTDSLGNNITVSATTTQYLTSSFRYVTIVKDSGTYKLTFSQESDDAYEDWGSEDYDSDLMSGFKVHGQGVVKFQTNYLTVFMKTEEDASCFLQSWWNYANTENSGKVTNSQQCYKSNSDFDISKYRLKIRGEGLALQFKLFSESGKPFTVLGWAGFETGNTLP